MDSRVASPVPLTAALALALLLGASPVRAGVRIVPPDEVAANWIETRDGVTFLTVDGRRWDLITDPASPEISTLGDGAFHPMDPREVERAVEAIEDIRGLSTRIFILPFPRRATLRSSCEDGAIFLSPGIRPVAAVHVHATVAHEMGHVIQQAWAREGSAPWAEYWRLRGLDPVRHAATAAHADRAREIFAEDFRLLRGGATAAGAGAHENGELTAPGDVPGLSDWFHRLTRRIPLPIAERSEPDVSPNPFRLSAATAIEIRFAAGQGPVVGGTADVYDIAGRRVTGLTGHVSGPRTVSFLWDGRSPDGGDAGPGVYFVRWREHPDRGVARVHVLH